MSNLALENDYEIILSEVVGHFVEHGGYPIHVDRKTSSMVELHLPFFTVKKVNVHKDRPYEITLTKKIPPKFLIDYYKNELKYEREHYNELYQKVKKIAEEF